MCWLDPYRLTSNGIVYVAPVRSGRSILTFVPSGDTVVLGRACAHADEVSARTARTTAKDRLMLFTDSSSLLLEPERSATTAHSVTERRRRLPQHRVNKAVDLRTGR